MDSKAWRISNINLNYTFCETYPSLFAVPSSTSDKELELVAEFRSKGRIPVLSWIKPNSQNVAILRSSQPLCGLSGKRSYWDEIYLKSITELNEANKINVIFDLKINFIKLKLKMLFTYLTVRNCLYIK